MPESKDFGDYKFKGAAYYRIVVEGQLSPAWSDRLAGLSVLAEDQGERRAASVSPLELGRNSRYVFALPLLLALLIVLLWRAGRSALLRRGGRLRRGGVRRILPYRSVSEPGYDREQHQLGTGCAVQDPYRGRKAQRSSLHQHREFEEPHVCQQRGEHDPVPDRRASAQCDGVGGDGQYHHLWRRRERGGANRRVLGQRNPTQRCRAGVSWMNTRLFMMP